MSEHGATPPPDERSEGHRGGAGQPGNGQPTEPPPAGQPGEPPYAQPPAYGESPPPPPPSGPPPIYGEPEYGQPPAPGQPGHGQPASGPQPAPAQPAYGQPEYGAPPANPAPYGQNPYAEPPYGQTPYGQAPYGQAPYGQTPYGQTPYGQNPYDQSGYGPSGYGPGGQWPIPPDIRFASMGRRFGARIIDGLVMTVLIIILSVVVFGIFGAGGAFNDNSDPYGNSTTDGAAVAAVLIWLALIFVALIGYEVALVAKRGATFGKQILGIKVVRVADGQVPGWGPSLVRWVIPFGASLLCFIGAIVVYLSPFFDSSGRNQGWYDQAAKTVVISR